MIAIHHATPCLHTHMESDLKAGETACGGVIKYESVYPVLAHVDNAPPYQRASCLRCGETSVFNEDIGGRNE